MEKEHLITPEFEEKLKNRNFYVEIRYDLEQNVFVVSMVDNKLKHIEHGVLTNEDISLMRAGKKTQVIF